MTRSMTAAALGALLLCSAPSMAATSSTPTTPALHTSTPAAPVNYAQRCTALSGQWKSALDGHELSPNLGKAKADAANGEKLCKSTAASEQKRGAGDYEAALKLLGVKPI